jgi:L-fuculose-phosphate aldolase
MWEYEKKEVLEAAQRMARRGLVVGTSGNVSMRLDSLEGREALAITPTGLYYDSLTVDDIAIVDFEGQRMEGNHTSSIETMLHIGVYRARKKVSAVIHTHPIFGSILAVTGIEIPPILDDQVTYLGGEIKIAPYALPGSQELVQNVVSALGPRNALILANHGALCVGRDMKEAFTNCEMLEKTARVYLAALATGKVNTLRDEAYALEKAFFDYHFAEGQTL